MSGSLLVRFARRLLGCIPVLFALTVILFALQQIAPADPVRAIVGTNARPEAYEAARERLGLDDPLTEQYVRYVVNAVQGDLGESVVTSRPVTTDIRTFLPASLELVGFTLFLVAVFGLTMGLVSTMRWPGAQALRGLMVCLASVPTFLVGLVLLMVLYRRFDLFPASGRTSIDDVPSGPTGFLTIDGLLSGRPDVTVDAISHLIMPAICLGLVSAASVGRVFRSSLTNTMRSDHVRTAKAKGLADRTVVRRHGVRNSINPVLALWGMQLAWLLGAALIVESMFGFPGVGLYITQAIDIGDFNSIAGVTLVLGTLYVVVNVVIDLVQSKVDPRVVF
jgi:peptide/nickel transport system permease protein